MPSTSPARPWAGDSDGRQASDAPDLLRRKRRVRVVREARRGEEAHLPERGMFRRKRTGEIVDPAYLDFASRTSGATTCCLGSTTSGAQLLHPSRPGPTSSLGLALAALTAWPA